MARSVPAVVRALDVLELFLDGRGSLSAPEVAAALDLPRTTTHELLATLSERDYVERLPDNAHRFRLGIRVSELGSVYADAIDVVRDGQALVDEVSARCGEICQLGLLDGRDVVYVARAGLSAAALAAVDSTPLAINPRRTPAVRTAAGRVLLAHLPRPDLERRLTGVPIPSSGLPAPLSGPGALSGPGLSGPVQSGPVQSGPAQSGPAQSGPAQSGPRVQSGPGALSAGSPSGPGGPPTSNGRVAGAAAGPQRAGAAVGGDPTDAAAAERVRIWRDLAAVVARGVATDPENVDQASRAISAAVRDHTGRVVAALEIRTPVARWEPQRAVGLETLVRRAAIRASARLGFRPPRGPEAGTPGPGAAPRSIGGMPGVQPRVFGGMPQAGGAPGTGPAGLPPTPPARTAPPRPLPGHRQLPPPGPAGIPAGDRPGGGRPPTAPGVRPAAGPVPGAGGTGGRSLSPVRAVDGGARAFRPAAAALANGHDGVRQPGEGGTPRPPQLGRVAPARRPLPTGRTPVRAVPPAVRRPPLQGSGSPSPQTSAGNGRLPSGRPSNEPGLPDRGGFGGHARPPISPGSAPPAGAAGAPRTLPVVAGLGQPVGREPGRAAGSLEQPSRPES